MKIFSYIIILILLLLGVTFALLNANIVTIHYYFGVSHAPLSLLIVFSFGLGLLVGLLGMSFVVLKQKAIIFHLRRKVKSAEEATVTTHES